MSSINTSCRSICLAALFFAVSLGALAQTTIWEEDFNSYSNNKDSGNASGFAPGTWNSGNDVRIRSRKIQTRDENDDGFWRTDPINISGFTNLILSFDTEYSNLRSNDRFSVRYRMDGGLWVTLVVHTREPDESYSLAIPSASTLEIEVLFDTNDEDSRYSLDNVVLQGDLAPCSNQLDYEFYDLVPAGTTVTNIPTTGAMGTGKISTFNVDNLQNIVDPGDTDSFSIRYKGYVHIPTTETYTFYTNSDDGSNLYIDGVKIVDNDGDHGMQERSGTVALTSGLHTIEVLFYENGGDEELLVSVSSPSLSKMALPFSNLYSDCTAPPVDETGNEPPTLTATGNQVFCPGSSMSIVETVGITDPDDTELGMVFIQITTNYDAGDLLSLTGSNPGITSSWSALEGKLTLTGPASLAVFETAIKNVKFSSTATLDSDTKNFSIVLAEANYLQNTQHYYEYIPAVGITWTDARDAAAARTFYGLHGYLATITTAEEAQLLGSQASGAGWIGANDAAVEGQWRWVTGPEGQEASGQGRLFWTGTADGTAVDYANWNNGEPNNSGEEDYAHINAPGTGFDGSWNDLSNAGSGSGEYQPKGYLVEYGGMSGDPVLPTITAVTSLTPFVIDTPDHPVDQTVFDGNQAHFSVTVNNADSYQWQVSTDNGLNFVNIANGSDYSGANTANLTVLKTNLNKNNNLYRVRAHSNTANCDAISSTALLKVKVKTVISNRRITYRVDKN